MSDVWYYAVGGEQKGPLSFKELIDALSGVSDLKRISVWRNGFEEWTTADQIREISAELSRPPSLPKQLSGIKGWLVVVALGQILTPLRQLWRLAQYISSLDRSLVEKFPVPFLGEATIAAGIVAFSIYTSVLFFRKSRKFPTCFILEWTLFAAGPFIDAAWVALTTPSQFVNLLDAKKIGTSIGTAFVGGIWTAYILRSKRVANTFVK